MKLKRRIIFTLSFLIGLFTVFLLVDFVFPFKTEVQYSTTILDANSNILNTYLTDDDKWRLYLEEDEITEEFEKAILFKEDQYFYSHLGINPISIVRAAYKNVVSGKRTSGASTITMQLARLLNPKSRTYGNKLIEMFNAIQLEWHLEKKEILRLYLNLLPYGGNIEGLKSASVMYFGKNPDLLSISEIAGLSIIPNRPSSLSIGIHNQAINEAKNVWLNRFKSAELFDSYLIDLAISEDLNPRRRSAPKEAQHLSLRLKSQKNSSNIRTHINLGLQRKIEQLTKNHVNSLRSMNIRNAAVLVIENKSRKVISYVGSADFYDSRDGGQVDGIRAVRSPGSTLKPLLFALRFDDGTLTPKSRIADVRISFDGYSPVNYDNELHGWITAEQALVESLNIPAVQLLSEYGAGKFVTKLVDTNFETLEQTQDDLGLSVILGGCGATLEELTSLYATFASKGIYQKPSYTVADSSYNQSEFLSEGASFILSDILTKVVRPSLPDSWRDNPNMPRIAWKTGTSFGRRDGWSIGYNEDYTIGVWVGNFSGEGAPDLSGSQTAAPLLFNVFNLVDNKTSKDWNKRPKSVAFKYVCNESGQLPNDFCANQVVDSSIKSKTKYIKCQHLQPVFVSSDSSVSYCQSCLKSVKSYLTALYPSHPPELIDYFDSEKITYTQAPSHYQFCERVYPDQGLEIISPTDNALYYVDENDTNQMMLKALAPSNATTFYWYINDVFYQSTNADSSIYFTPPSGKVKISCSDDRGRNKDVMIEVKNVEF